MLKKIKKFIKFPASIKIRILLTIILVGLLIFGLSKLFVVFFKSDNAYNPVNKIQKISNIESKPASSNVSPEYLQTLLKQNKIKSQQAILQGKSNIPDIVNTSNLRSNKESLIASNINLKSQQEGSLLERMLDSGAITPEVAAYLSKLQNENLSVSDYAKRLQELVAEGKLTPEQAAALLAAYKKTHGKDKIVNKNDKKKILADILKNLNSQNLTPEEYAKRLQELVAEGLLTPEQAAALLAKYNKKYAKDHSPVKKEVKTKKNQIAKMLATMQAQGQIDSSSALLLQGMNKNNISAAQFASELNQLITANAISANTAKKLLGTYIGQHGSTKVKEVPNNPGLTNIRRQQQQQQLLQQQRQMALLSSQQQQQKNAQQVQQQQQIQNNMMSQARTLLASWTAPQPLFTNVDSGSEAADKAALAAKKAALAVTKQISQAPILKMGTILFAVLKTSINSDEPGPVLATIVTGKYAGAQIIGTLKRQKEKLLLTFDHMTYKDWPNSIKINAVAIDADTARTALASDVNHHYLSRYASLFASSFISGYGQATENSGNSSTSRADGSTTSSTSEYNTKDKIEIGLGEVAKQLSVEAKKNFTRPPTVTVNSGVGFGLLFKQDVMLDTKNNITNNTQSTNSAKVSSSMQKKIQQQKSNNYQ